MNQAENLMANPTDELRQAVRAVQEGSASSESEAITQFDFDDGSQLLVRSFQGAEAQLEVVHPPEEE